MTEARPAGARDGRVAIITGGARGAVVEIGLDQGARMR